MDMPYPYYLLNVQAPDETGTVLTVHIERGAGGLLPGQTEESILAGIRRLLEQGVDGVSSQLTRFEIKTTNNL